MSTLGSILNIARSALHAHQTAVRVASQNISNAQTEGYTRQRVRLTATDPDVTPLGRMGTGVRVFDVTRIRDTLLDISFRRESGRAASYDVRQQTLMRMEEILGEPSETGLAQALDAFFSSWSDLANQPTSDTARRLAVQSGQHIANTLQGFSARLDELEQHTRLQLTTSVKEANRLSEAISRVNDMIVREESGGRQASDLRDQRDRLLDDLAKIGTIQVINRTDGSVGVLLENAMVVDGGQSKPLSAVGEPPEVRLGAMTVSMPSEGSVLAELVNTLKNEIPQLQGRLDEIAEALVTQVNMLHEAGYLPDGTAGGPFFDAAGTTARNIRVVVTSQQVAVSDEPGQSGNNRIALAIAAMRGDPAQNEIAGEILGAPLTGIGGNSFAEHYRGVVADLAVATRQARDSAEVFGVLESQLEIRRSAMSGVSTDEELITVMQHQQAYTAAARLVNVVDEMMQTILDLKR
jgi:flagellar hook-associated protein 1